MLEPASLVHLNSVPSIQMRCMKSRRRIVARGLEEHAGSDVPLEPMIALVQRNLDEACHVAARAAGLLHTTPYATGISRLRALRNAADNSDIAGAFGMLDQQLARLTAA